MKFLVSLFVAGAIAAHIGTPVVKRADIVERDIATITSAISSISSALTALDSQVQSFSGAGDVASLQSASEAVLTAINNGNSAIEGEATLSEADALTLTSPVQALGSTVSSTIDDLIAKKSAFDSAGVGGVVLQQLQQQQTATQTFSTTLISKVPDSLQSIAQQLAAPITTALQKGVDAFQGESVTTGGGSSPTTTAEGSSPTTTEEGSSPTTTEEGSSPTTTGEGSGSTETAGGAPTETGGASPTTTGSGSGSGSGNGTVTGSLPTQTILTGAAPLATAANFIGAMAMVAAIAAF